MPSGVIDDAHDEKLWERAKGLAADSGHTEDYPYIMSIYRKLGPHHEFKTAAVGRMPGNALTNPARYGLMPCDIRYGQIVDRPRQQVMTTGNQCRLLNEQLDEHTFVWFFVGLGADNKPILARNEHELERLKLEIEKARLHSEYHSASVRVAARYKELFEHPPEGEGSMAPPLRDINGEGFAAPDLDPMELLGYKWKDTSKAFHQSQPEPAGVVRMSPNKTAAKPPVYVGAFLTPESKRALLSAIPAQHGQVFAEHCTLWFKPSAEELAQYTLGQKINLKTQIHVFVGKGQAVSVVVPHDVPCKNQHPHITISCAPGTGPVYSNELLAQADERMPIHINLTAVVDTFPRSVS